MRVLLIISTFFLVMVAQAQDELCGERAYTSTSREQILICFEPTNCIIEIPQQRFLAPGRYDADRPIQDIPSNEYIDAGMMNYQREKNICRAARMAGDDDTAFTAQLNMLYWENVMFYGGAYGVELAAPYETENELRERTERAGEALIILEELYGLPK